MSFLAQVSYTGNGSTTQYSITFPYIDVTHVKAYLDGVLTTAYTISSSTLTFTTAPANGVVIRIERETPNTTRLIDFTDGSVLTESDLDASADQNFYIAQEITDDSASKLGLDTDDKYDANNKVIKNLANPVNNNDAVNKTYLENTWLSTSDKANLTTVAGISGAVSTVAGISSAVTGVNSNNANVSTVAGQISPTNNISTLAGINSDITNVANNNADISTVAGQISPTNNIATLAGLDTELSAIYNIRTNITNVDTNSTNVNLVAGQISPTNNILTLGGLSSQISTLGALGTEITNLNTIRTDISSVSGQISPTNNISTLAGLNTEISALYNIRTDITAVSNIASDIQDVQDKIAELQTVANDLNEATSEIETVAGSINQVDAVGNDLLGANNIGTVATNLSGVNYFGERYRVSATAPTTSLDIGDLYYDTTTDAMKVYGSSGWQNAGSSVNGTSQRYNYTATASQTTFTGADNNGNTLAYDAGYIDVYLNGVKLLNGTDVTVTSGTSVVLATGATAGDIVDIVAYGTFSVASLNADNLDSGTVPIARLSGAYTGITQTGTLTSFASTGIDDNATSTAITIDSSERVMIGTTDIGYLGYADNLTIGSASGDNGITIRSGTTNTSAIYFSDATGTGTGTYAGVLAYDHNTNVMNFYTNSTERMRIDSSGDMLMGTTTNTGNCKIFLSDSATGSQIMLGTERALTSSATHIGFYNPNGRVGTISTSGTATAYNTSSDYRLKENVSYDFDATSRLKQLKPARFNFIADADTTVDGFIAHEVQSIVPEAITGEKDETETKEKVVVNTNGKIIAENIEQADWETGKIADENGNTQYPTDSTWEATKVVPVYQGIDQAKLVPLLVKTIQELEARITTLETKVTTLENA